MAPSAAELFKQATDKRARFADGQTGVSKKRNQEITVGQLYLRSWWPYCMLKLQRMRTSKLWVCRWFFHFFELYWPTIPYGPWLPGCLLQRRVSEADICVCGVSSPLFSFAATHLHCCQDQQNERMAALNIERKNGRSERQNVKSSNDRFFLSWQVFPSKLRHWDSQGLIVGFGFWVSGFVIWNQF